jgi:hypothetical protein
MIVIIQDLVLFIAAIEGPVGYAIVVDVNTTITPQ